MFKIKNFKSVYTFGKIVSNTIFVTGILYLKEEQGRAVVKKIIFVMMELWMAGPCWADENSITSYSFSLRDTPKYSQGFTHFDYVNPDSSKGGSVTLSTTGTL